MGVDIKSLLVREKTNLESFASKIIAIDAYNAFYQFLAIIRGPEEMHLTNSRERLTIHLTGLLYKNVNKTVIVSNTICIMTKYNYFFLNTSD